MRIRQKITQEPTASAVVGQTVRVRRVEDSVTVATLTSDEFGLVDYIANGSPGPFYLNIESVPGGDKYWDVRDAGGAGALALADLPLALALLGDGVVRGVEEELAVSVLAEGSLLVEQGTALVNGIPVSNFTQTAIAYVRPVTSTRVDRVIVRLYPPTSSTTPGYAAFGLLGGEEGGVAPTLTQTTSLWEIPLATVTIPVVAPLTVTDARTYVGAKGVEVADLDRVTSFSTTDTSGVVITDLSVTLPLSRTTTYDIVATLDVYQDQTGTAAPTAGWGVAATYDLSLSGVAQLAASTDGTIYAAVTNSGQVLHISAAGSTLHSLSIGTPYGVCTDGTTVYVGNAGGISAYTTSLTGPSLTNSTTAVNARHLGLATGSISAVISSPPSVLVFTASTLAYLATLATSLTSPVGVAASTTSRYVIYGEGGSADRVSTTGSGAVTWGGTGTATGQFNEPNGIAIDASGNVWVADAGNNRVQRFSSAGVYQLSIDTTNPTGICVDTSGNLWVANGTTGVITKWSDAVVPPLSVTPGYGQIAIEIDGTVGTYLGIGNMAGLVSNAQTGSKAGMGTCVVRGFAKATSNSVIVQQAVLTAHAVPRG